MSLTATWGVPPEPAGVAFELDCGEVVALDAASGLAAVSVLLVMWWGAPGGMWWSTWRAEGRGRRAEEGGSPDVETAGST